MGVARLRRLTTLFVLLGLFLPVAPYALGFPYDYDNHGCFLPKHVGVGTCLEAGLACLFLAGAIRATSWSQLTEGQRWGTWPGLIFVLFQLLAFPLEADAIPVWYLDRLH